MMKKTIEPDRKYENETEAHLPLIEDFLASLEVESYASWQKATEFSIAESAARVRVFGMPVLVPNDLMSQERWSFRVSQPAEGIRILHVNDRALGAFVSEPATREQITDLPCEILSLHWDAYPFAEAPSLEGFPQLTALSLVNCSKLNHLAALSKLTQLTKLDLIGCDKLHDLGPLSHLTGLTELSVVNSESLTDLSPLSKLANLKRLDLRMSTALKDLAPLATLFNLESLDLAGCDAAIDTSPLSKLSKLGKIKAGNPYLPDDSEAEIREHLGDDFPLKP